jgi:RNA polymerase sigma factor (TIGR02999 family)
MASFTHLLEAAAAGDRQAAAELLPLVYDELRQLAATRLAAEPAGLTLQPTALVHEAYLRLVDVETAQQWNSRGHFFAAAAEAMRRILVDGARSKRARKRGGERKRLEVDLGELAACEDDPKLLALDEALVRLERQHPTKAQLVKLRYFTGMSIREAAEALAISTATADRYWAYARAWLQREMTGADS